MTNAETIRQLIEQNAKLIALLQSQQSEAPVIRQSARTKKIEALRLYHLHLHKSFQPRMAEIFRIQLTKKNLWV